MSGKLSIYIGYEPREIECFAVCRSSIRRRLTQPVPIRGLVLDEMRRRGFYTRPTEYREGQLWDVISEAPMSTEFAIARFLTPLLAGTGWALFMDCDIMARDNLMRLFEMADPEKAVMCVKHHHEPPDDVKMDDQIQTRYKRKNWSSVMLFNCDHPSNRRLTVDLINTVPGRDLHAFCWLEDDEIGELPERWNYLVGHTKGHGIEPALVHWTNGPPCMPGFEDEEYAEEFREEIKRWAL